MDVEKDEDQILHHVGISILNNDHQVDIVVVNWLARQDPPLVVYDVLKNLLLFDL